MNSPSVPASVAPALRIFLTWVRQKLTGGGMDRNVTFGDLVQMGVVSSDVAQKQSEK